MANKKTIHEIRHLLQKDVDYIIEISNLIERSYDYLDAKEKEDNHLDVDRIINMQLGVPSKRYSHTARETPHRAHPVHKPIQHIHKAQLPNQGYTIKYLHGNAHKIDLEEKVKKITYNTVRNTDSFLRSGFQILIESIKFMATK